MIKKNLYLCTAKSPKIFCDRGRHSVGHCKGEMPEWSIGPHSKCGVRVTVPGVRIPLSPQRNYLYGERRQDDKSCRFCFERERDKFICRYLRSKQNRRNVAVVLHTDNFFAWTPAAAQGKRHESEACAVIPLLHLIAGRPRE